MRAAYEPPAPRERQARGRWWRWWRDEPAPDWQVALAAAAVVTGAWRRDPLLAVVAAGVGGCVLRRPRGALALAALLLASGWWAERAWQATAPDRLGPFAGWVTVVEDPAPVAGALRVVVEVEGERFQAYLRGSPRRRLAAVQAGERVALVAERGVLSGPNPDRARARHVVGSLRVERVLASAEGAPATRAANRIRDRLREVAGETMAPAEAALFTGLVIGDDSRQDRATVERFRAAGLSHLTAVSGQNVAYVLAMAGMALRALRPWPRWAATVALIAWFCLVTRFEPSVLRAGVMAALSATAFAVGRDRSPLRVLALAVLGLVVVDPLLVHSIAFWLSVGATAGVTGLAPALERRLGGPRWLAAPLAVALGAQLGVLAPSWLVFGRLPPLGTPANLLAVPVAGLVMLWGLPVALVAASLPDVVARVVMLPARLGTRWIGTVAAVVERVQPAGGAALACWVLQLVILAWLLRLGTRRPRDEPPARTLTPRHQPGARRPPGGR